MTLGTDAWLDAILTGPIFGGVGWWLVLSSRTRSHREGSLRRDRFSTEIVHPLPMDQSRVHALELISMARQSVV